MELFLDNIGIIKNSTVKIDGLTIITGKNNSGKTTVGKAMYSLIRANGNLEMAYETSRKAYIIAKLNEISMILTARRFFMNKRNSQEDSEETVSKTDRLINVLRFRKYRHFSTEELLSYLHELKNNLPSLTFIDTHIYSNKDDDFLSQDRPIFDKLTEDFEERKQMAIKSCSLTINTVENKSSYDSFFFERLKSFLNLSFRNQINPVRETKVEGCIRLDTLDHTLMELHVRNQSNFTLLQTTPFVFPYTQAIFIDDPFILDRLDTGHYDYFSGNENENVISSVDLVTHRDYLIQLLTAKAPENFFDNMELQEKYNALFKKINLIVPGEFQETKEGMFYVDDNAKLNVQNLATGSKLFFIIKMLLMNGKLNGETVLVLDEPESHLHPDWINKFAEILALLVKELQLCILLTTHSPNLLLALEWFVKSYGIKNQSHFYLAHELEGSEWASTLECIDENINKGYAHLTLPLIEMSIVQKAAEEKEY